MNTPGSIEALIADLRLTAGSLQQVLDACQVVGPGAELAQHYPKMLAELADRFADEAEHIEWPADLQRDLVLTLDDLVAIEVTEALLGKLLSDGGTHP